MGLLVASQAAQPAVPDLRMSLRCAAEWLGIDPTMPSEMCHSAQFGSLCLRVSLYTHRVLRGVPDGPSYLFSWALPSWNLQARKKSCKGVMTLVNLGSSIIHNLGVNPLNIVGLGCKETWDCAIRKILHYRNSPPPKSKG